MTLKVQNISKSYGKHLVLESIDFELKSGLIGLLGPNGAGKTTLINIILGILPADGGEILADGENVQKNRKSMEKFISRVGYLPQFPKFYKDFRAREFLQYIAVLKGLEKKASEKRIEELLETVNLTNAAQKKVGAFSGGMRQRLGIAQAMLNDPELLILDEPTAGLDPKERIRFRNLISKFATDRIVILSTHIVPDVEFVANEVIILGGATTGTGGIISIDSPKALREGIKSKVLEVKCDEAEINRYLEHYNISNVFFAEGKYTLKIVAESGSEVPSSAIEAEPTLEDVFLYHFGGGM
jgi:ABC-2 type transport system ATP-binding protein